MTKKESIALIKAGIIFGKIKYQSYTKSILSPLILLKSNFKTWPALPKNEWEYRNGYGIGSTTSIISFLGHDVGLHFDSNGDKISVSLSHPLAKFWLSILQPIWDEQNKGKCKTCHGSGWDGIGYILTCVDCGGTAKGKTIPCMVNINLQKQKRKSPNIGKIVCHQPSLLTEKERL